MKNPRMDQGMVLVILRQCCLSKEISVKVLAHLEEIQVQWKPRGATSVEVKDI